MSDIFSKNENGIAGKPLYPTASTPGHAFDSFQASNAPAPFVEKPPQKPSATLPKKDAMYRLRTFESDVADAVKNNQASVVKMVVAEKERKQETIVESRRVESRPVPMHTPYTAPRSKRNILFPLLSIFLIVIGGGILFYFFKNKPTIEPAPLPQIPAGIISVESAQRVPLPAEKNIVINVAGLQGEPQENTIVGITFTEDTTPLEAQRFATLLNTSVPTFFIRALKPTFSTGLHFIPSGQPFIIFKTNSYENAFAGMLSWEPSMFNDLSSPFGLNPSLIPQSAFQDKIIQNKNVRELVDNTGIVLLLYSFFDKETLIITTNEETFKEITRRLML